MKMWQLILGTAGFVLYFVSPAPNQLMSGTVTMLITPMATEVTKNDVPEEDIYRCIMKELNLRRRRRWMWMAAAAIIPLLILSGVLAFSGLQSSGYSSEMEMAHLTVPSGDKMHVVFQDGSTALLNSRSSISYPNRFGRRSREVHLEGEAYFNIEKNPKRPFIIKLHDAQ